MRKNLIKINSNREIIKMDNDVVDQQHKIKQKSDHLAQVDELQVFFHKFLQNHQQKGFGKFLQQEELDFRCEEI